MVDIRTAKKILGILDSEGFEGYIVGGAVRDYLLRIEISDIDITTDAKPQIINKIFRKTKPTGLKYGTITVLMDGGEFQVTTFRVDTTYSDNRHPDGVVFTTSIEEDVKRRDFTINGLLMDANDKIIDYVDGETDLKNKIIRTIGNPDERFNEDSLRILRAIYFQSKLGFQISKETREAITRNIHLVENIAKERILTEILKILRGSYIKMAFKSLVTTNLVDVLPGLKEGIIHFSNDNFIPFTDVFFATCFALSSTNDIDYYPFSNKQKNLYSKASTLAKTTTVFSNEILYKYGLEIVLLANKVNRILKKSNIKNEMISKQFDDMPLKSELDLKLRGKAITELLDKKPGAWLNELHQEMISLIFAKKLENNLDSLQAFVINKYHDK